MVLEQAKDKMFSKLKDDLIFIYLQDFDDFKCIMQEAFCPPSIYLVQNVFLGRSVWFESRLQVTLPINSNWRRVFLSAAADQFVWEVLNWGWAPPAQVIVWLSTIG